MSASRRVVVGLFVLGGVFLFALGLFWIGDRRLLFSDNMELHTEFTNLSGLKVGSKVMVRGMDAGEVLTIQVPSRPKAKFRVQFRTLAQFRPILRTDSVATIQIEGIVGSKILQVDAGTDAKPQVESGGTIPSREPLEISQIIDQATDTLNKMNDAVDEVQKRVVGTVDTVTTLGEEARKLVVEVGGDVQTLLTSSGKVVAGAEGLVADVRKGKGFVGRLVADDKLYDQMKTTVNHIEMTAANANRTSERAQRIVADVESRKLGESLQKTAANVEQVTARLKDVLAELKPAGGPDARGLLDDVRDSLDNTREATSDMAENMEALKRNWFFRGYFNRRGFFDLDAVSLEDYRQGKIASKRDRKPTRLPAEELFKLDKEGREIISESGAKKLGEAMVPFLRYAPNTLLMVEGYSGRGSEQERFLLARDRARLVRRYLVDRFGLKPNFVGAIPMVDAASAGAPGESQEAVTLVFFPEKK